jgi:3-dehydroquinate synthase
LFAGAAESADTSPVTALRIPIDIPNAPTSLVVERGAVSRLGEVLAREGVPVAARAVVLAVDGAIRATHGALAERAIAAAGGRVAVVALEADERAKSMRAVERVWSAALESGAGRDALVVALGGGLVGDLAGFAAATYLRGVDLVQVPTTLLAMVDASIGGKTGVNLELPGGGLGKNLAGAFWQPKVTIADADTLSTLPMRELRAGLAECAKHAVISGEDAFAALERDAAARGLVLHHRYATLDQRRDGLRSRDRALIVRVRGQVHERARRLLLQRGGALGEQRHQRLDRRSLLDRQLVVRV